MPKKKSSKIREAKPREKQLQDWQVALKRRIKASGYSQASFARAAKIREETLNRMLNKAESNPELTSIKGVLTSLGIDFMGVFDQPGTPADTVTRMVFDAINGLNREDKITLLRIITRLRNSPEKTSEIIRTLMQQILK